MQVHLLINVVDHTPENGPTNIMFSTQAQLRAHPSMRLTIAMIVTPEFGMKTSTILALQPVNIP
jgi:hypothetical protein